MDVEYVPDVEARVARRGSPTVMDVEAVTDVEAVRAVEAVTGVEAGAVRRGERESDRHGWRLLWLLIKRGGLTYN